MYDLYDTALLITRMFAGWDLYDTTLAQHIIAVNTGYILSAW